MRSAGRGNRGPDAVLRKLPLLREEENKVWWMLSTLTDQVLGEIPAMALIDGFDVLDAPRDGVSVSPGRAASETGGYGNADRLGMPRPIWKITIRHMNWNRIRMWMPIGAWMCLLAPPAARRWSTVT